MTAKKDLIPKYLSEDGRYLGFLSDEEIKDKTAKKLRFNDNNLEHIVKGTVVSSAKTKEGLYSYLAELDPPAPQRLRDYYYFIKEHHFAVGEVRKEQLKLYSNSVFRVGMPLAFTFTSESKQINVPLRGTVVLEEKSTKAPQFKYAFWLKLDKELSDEEYTSLKKIDVDDVGNYDV
jgi:hypothetical protein